MSVFFGVSLVLVSVFLGEFGPGECFFWVSLVLVSVFFLVSLVLVSVFFVEFGPGECFFG